MVDRRTSLTALVLLALAAAGAPARAAEVAAYTPQAFAAAEKAGGPILIEITAPWCPTCKAQKPILGRLEAEPRFQALKVFAIDFDSQKDAVRAFGARMQSTLIAFKGATEVARSVGDTSAPSIEGLLDKSL